MIFSKLLFLEEIRYADFCIDANELRTNVTARRTFVRRRVTCGKPQFRLSVLNVFPYSHKNLIIKYQQSRRYCVGYV